MIVLYVGTQLIASVITMVGGDKTQQRIMFALPFVFTIFIINFEAGLIVYWITTNVWTIGQQLVVRKLYPKPQVLAETGPRRRAARTTGNGRQARARQARREGRRPRRQRGGAPPSRRPAPRARRRSAPAGAGSPMSEPDTQGRGGGGVPRRGQVRGHEGARAALPRASPWSACASRSPRRATASPARVVGEVDEDAWRDVAEADLPEEPAERLRAVVTRVVQTLALDATVDVERDRGGAPRDGRGRGSRPADRQARRDDRRAPARRHADRAPRRRSASRSSSTRRATASGARRPCTARPTAPWRTRCATSARSSSSRCARSSARSSTPTCAERTDIETHSEGDEPDRRSGGLPGARLTRVLTVSRETLRELAARHGLAEDAAERFERLLDALEAEPDPPTTVRGADAADRHLADSLTGLEVPELAGAAADRRPGRRRRLPGAGAGGRAARTRSVDLIEATTRKCEVIDRLAARGRDRRTPAPSPSGPRTGPRGRARGLRRRHRARRWRRWRCSPSTRPRCCARAGCWSRGRARGTRTRRRAAPPRPTSSASIAARGAAGGAVRGRREPASARAARRLRPRPAGFPRRPGMARKRPLS